MRKISLFVALIMLVGLMPIAALGVEVPVPAPEVPAQPEVPVAAPVSDGPLIEIVWPGTVNRPRLGPVVSPDFSVEFGWFVYIYLNANDWAYYQSIGWGVAFGLLCVYLAPSVAPGLACGVAASILSTLWALPAPPPGYCVRMVYTYTGTYYGSSYVWRAC